MNTPMHAITGRPARELTGRGTRVSARVAAVLGLAMAPLAGGQPVAAAPESAGSAAQQPGVIGRIEPPAQPVAAPDPARAGVPLAPPEPAEALRALGLVRSWLNDWAIGDRAAPPVACACVTLRLDGAVIGRAEAVATDDSAGHGVIEEALAAAMTQAQERVSAERDALWLDRMKQIGRDAIVTLELGGVAIPVDVASFPEAATMVSPGVAGVGARVGTGPTARTSLVFPSAMVGAGMDAGAALASASADALGESDAALAGAAVLSGRGVRFLAFQTVWVTEVGDDRVGMILHRGGRVYETRDVNTPMLRQLGGRLADVLAHPPPSTHAESNSAAEQRSRASFGAAMSAYALACWAATPGSGSDEQRLAWADSARQALVDASPALEQAQPAAAALWVMVGACLAPAPNSAGPAEDERIARGRAGEALVRTLGRALDGAPAAPGTGPERAVSPPVAAMLAWAGAWRGGALGDPDLVELAGRVLRDAYARTPAGEWVGLMPWAGWAEQELAVARQRQGGPRAIEGATALRDIRDLVWKHQVGQGDVGPDDRDLVGGIVFTRGRQPLPTWQSLRPLASIATMLGDPELTPEAEFPGQVLRLLTSLRFLRQLCADESAMTWADGPAWGVRAATWTDEQPEEATSLGLLVISHTLRSLDAVAQRRARVLDSTRN